MPNSFIRFNCGACGRLLKTDVKNGGKRALCLCGTKCKIPHNLAGTDPMPIRVFHGKALEPAVTVELNPGFSRIALALIVCLALVAGAALAFGITR